ncbi:MAG: hypothetical protein P1R58_13425, partial [bacterium]|nr:hypothetical protein [bacterium]
MKRMMVLMVLLGLVVGTSVHGQESEDEASERGLTSVQVDLINAIKTPGLSDIQFRDILFSLYD